MGALILVLYSDYFFGPAIDHKLLLMDRNLDLAVLKKIN